MPHRRHLEGVGLVYNLGLSQGARALLTDVGGEEDEEKSDLYSASSRAHAHGC